MHRSAGWLRQLFRLQFFLLFGLMPLTVLWFQRITPLALPINLVAVPLFSFVTVPCTLIGLMLGGGAGIVGHEMLVIAARSVGLVEALITWATGLPFVSITIAEARGILSLAVFLPALLALLPKGWPGRHVAFLAVVALLMQPPIRPPDGCIDTHVLDVGQGLATVVQTRYRTLVFDTGASYRGGGSAAEQVIVPFLRSRGLKRIDRLIVSHSDIDHSGGVAALADYAIIADVRAGELLADTGLFVTLCVAGQSWNDDGVHFRILSPLAGSSRDGNDASCVVLIETGRHAILLTGDIEAASERDITASRAWQRIDAVVVPHHGSLTSSSAAFVNAVAPRIAIVSSGFKNRWGFPKPEVVARWRATGAAVFNTASSGAVSFRLCRESGLGPPRLDRHERRRFWRDGADRVPKKRLVSQEFSSRGLYISFF
jgi:competence protein ComEC